MGAEEFHSRIREEHARYEKALREIVALMADRQRFVMLGIRGMSSVEQIAKAALDRGAEKP